MNALTFLKTMRRSERAAFAEKCGTTLGHLMNCAYGYKPIGPSLAMRLELHSKGALKVETMCPDEPWFVIRKKRAA